MKVLSIERRKNHEHIIGNEIREDGVVKNREDVRFLVEEYLNDLDGETYNSYQNEIESIYNLKNGFYVIDDGDFTLFIEIKDC